jgi:predicted AlkP superfamily pyrophosphatase or phosphodiesterase
MQHEAHRGCHKAITSLRHHNANGKRGYKTMKLTPAIAFLAGLFAAQPAAAQSQQPPKLVIALAVDQLGSNLFDEYRATFSGGLARLAREGVVFTNGYQAHAATETCPGHATLLTGEHPWRTGITGNRMWEDEKTRKQRGKDSGMVYCVADPDVSVIGVKGEGRSPRALLVPTLGDLLRKDQPAAKSFAISYKDRAALTMGGNDANGIFWWGETAAFTTWSITKGDEAQRLAPVKAFNDKLVKDWRSKPPRWQASQKRCLALRDNRTYGALTLSGDVPPAPWPAYKRGDDFMADTNFHRAISASPIMDQATLDLALHLIDTQALGKDAVPDLLAVSLSATDIVGHRFGQGGREMCEHLAALDAMLGVFFKALDARKLDYVIALSADHGGVDAAERASQRGASAQRLNHADTRKALLAALNERFGDGVITLEGDVQEIHFRLPAAREAERTIITGFAKDWLKRQSSVADAFTRTEVAAARPANDVMPDEIALVQRFALNFDPARSADLSVAYKPNWTTGVSDWPNAPGKIIAGHGSPWNYDRRVPLIFYRAGMRGFEQPLPVRTIDMGPTLAALIGVAMPGVEGRCLDLEEGESSSCIWTK